MSHPQRLLLRKDRPPTPLRGPSVADQGLPGQRRNTVLACNLCRRRKVRVSYKTFGLPRALQRRLSLRWSVSLN